MGIKEGDMEVSIGLSMVEVGKEEWNSLMRETCFEKQAKKLEDKHKIKIKAFLLANELDNGNWEIYYWLDDKKYEGIHKKFISVEK
jgi:hypothetical protein